MIAKQQIEQKLIGKCLNLKANKFLTIIIIIPIILSKDYNIVFRYDKVNKKSNQRKIERTHVIAKVE